MIRYTARWYEGPLASLAIGTTTGTNAESDRIVAAAVAVQSAHCRFWHVREWTVDQPSSVSHPATKGERLIPDQLKDSRANHPGPMLEDIARTLAGRTAAGVPLVVMDAPVVLTLLDRELTRHRGQPLISYLGSIPLCVLDPGVLHRHIDPTHASTRTLVDLCQLYSVPVTGPSGPAAAATAVLDLVRAIGSRYSNRLGSLNAAELHTRQAIWHAAQLRGAHAWFTANPFLDRRDLAWPLRPD